MSINLSDIKFPNYVTGIQDEYGEWLAGGYDYQSQAPGWTRVGLINQLIEFNLADLTWHDLGGGAYETDPYTVFTYPNGYTVRLTVHQSPQTGQGGTPYWIASNLYDLDGNAVGDLTGVYKAFYSNNHSYNTSFGNMFGGDCKAYVCLDTVYYPTANPLAGSPNLGLELMISLGFESYGFQVNVGTFAVSNFGAGMINAFFHLCTFYDLAAFETYLHNHGNPFDGDMFTDDPLPGEPAGGGDNSGTGGGGGNYDPTSDPIDFPSLPVGGPLTSGMIKGFVMNSGNLIGLQSKLWDMSIFDIATQFQKLVNQPLDCLISLHCLPFIPTEGTTPEEIKLGSFPTGISANRVAAQYMEIDAGSIAISEYWGSALDYAPFTQVEIYVPFVGIRNLKIEDIEGLTLALKYHVDVLTGDCVAYLKCGQSVLYSWTGNCLTHIPCTANSSDLLAKNIAAVGAVGVGLATGNPAAAAAGSIAGAVNTATAKNHVQRSGEVAGSSGLMSGFDAYLIFHRPKQSLAKDYNKFKGYTCNITYKLSTLKGYTEVEHVHLTGISGATDAELAEIKSLLTEGVII